MFWLIKSFLGSSPAFTDYIVCEVMYPKSYYILRRPGMENWNALSIVN